MSHQFIFLGAHKLTLSVIKIEDNLPVINKSIMHVAGIEIFSPCCEQILEPSLSLRVIKQSLLGKHVYVLGLPFLSQGSCNRI